MHPSLYHRVAMQAKVSKTIQGLKIKNQFYKKLNCLSENYLAKKTLSLRVQSTQINIGRKLSRSKSQPT